MNGFAVRIGALLFLSIGINSCTQDIHKTSSFKDIFDHYRSQQGVVAFSVPPALVSLVLEHAADSNLNDFNSLLKDLSAFRMIILEERKNFKSRKDELFDVVYQFTIRNEFNDFFVLRGGRDDLVIKVRENNNTIQEAIILIGAEDSFTVVNLKGKISPEYFSRLEESGFMEEFSNFHPWD